MKTTRWNTWIGDEKETGQFEELWNETRKPKLKRENWNTEYNLNFKTRTNKYVHIYAPL